ncbi:MAG: 1-(5-phosphoribosyl)-5-[(5-phosphoribosylamino)methylideneamino]imidazole-4-carboxamide isomerase [Spirochaetota bacterium]
MIFIPAIDLIDGKCVRLTQGKYSMVKEYNENPVDVARLFVDQGAKYLHIVDLDAARGEGKHNKGVISRIVRATEAGVEVGGGIRDRESVKELLDVGVERVILGTMIVKNSFIAGELVAEFRERIVAGIDARNGLVHISGWTEGSNLKAVELGRRVRDMGFQLIVYTDIARDGMLVGPDIEAIKEIALETSLPIIASGGVSGVEDIKALKTLESVGVIGVISGKALYEGRLSVKEACEILQA